MKKKRIIIVGIAILLIGVVLFIIEIQRQKVVVTQNTVYLGVFDVAFESQEQIDAFIAGRTGSPERQGGTIIFGDIIGRSIIPDVSWFARRENSPTIRLRWSSGVFTDRQAADESAVELVAYLVANNIGGVSSAESVPIVKCVWRGRGGGWAEQYFSDMIVVPTSDEDSVSPGRARYQLLDTPQEIDCEEMLQLFRQSISDSEEITLPAPAGLPSLDLEPTPLPEFLRN